MTESAQQNINQLRTAQEVLFDSNDVLAVIDSAITDGTVTAEPYVEQDGVYPSLYVAVPAERADIKLQAGANYYQDGSGNFDTRQFTWANPQKQAEEGLKVEAQLRARLGYEIAPWYLKDDLLAEKIDEGDPINQAFEFKVGDSALQMLNFSHEHAVSNEQLKLLQETLHQVVSSAGAGVMESVNGIAIVSHEDLNGPDRENDSNTAVGLFKNYNGLLFLSDRLLGDDSITNEKYGMDTESSHLQTTFAHELGHAAQNFYHDIYSDALGWKSQHHETVDSHGKITHTTDHTLDQPGAWQTVFKNGNLTPIPIEEHFTEEQLGAVRPNTDYGATQGMEDFAEASVPYFIEGRQTDKIDAVRSNAISTTLQKKYANANVPYGPYVVEAEQIDLNMLKQQPMSIKPQHLTIQVVAQVPSQEQHS